MSDGEALLRAIRADPADDLPRLAYADWLEENGETGRAEFIRLQLRLDRAIAIRCDTHEIVFARNIVPAVSRGLPRERELLTPCSFWEWFDPYAHGWAGAWPGSPAVAIGGGRLRGLCCDVGYWNGDDKARWQLTVSRGFVSGFRLPCDSWQDYGKPICAANPIERVGLSDKLPTRVGDLWQWTREVDGARDDLPGELYDAIDKKACFLDDYQFKVFASEALALGALSDACVLWAKG